MTRPFGYPSPYPCRVCRLHNNNQVEPRFSYTVCEDHQDIPPAYLDQARQLYEAGKPLTREAMEALHPAHRRN